MKDKKCGAFINMEPVECNPFMDPAELDEIGAMHKMDSQEMAVEILTWMTEEYREGASKIYLGALFGSSDEMTVAGALGIWRETKTEEECSKDKDQEMVEALPHIWVELNPRGWWYRLNGTSWTVERQATKDGSRYIVRHGQALMQPYHGHPSLDLAKQFVENHRDNRKGGSK